MEIQIKAYAYTIDIITEIRYFCKCNNAVFGKFRIIFTCAISKTDCSLHHNFHALFKISGNGKFVRTAVLPPRPSRNLSKSTPRTATEARLYTRELKVIVLYQPFQNPTIPCPAPSRLPPLSKGGGLTASHKLSLCCILIATHPPFLFTKLFCRQDRGIASSPSLTCTNPPKPTLSLSLFVGEGLVSRVTWFTLCASTWFTCYQ